MTDAAESPTDPYPTDPYSTVSGRTPLLPRLMEPRVLTILCIVGLAAVYLTNGLIAIIQPEDFTSLVETSRLTSLFGVDALPGIAWIIAVNDLLIGAVLLLSTKWLPRLRAPMLAWSGVWLFVIALIKLTALHALVC